MKFQGRVVHGAEIGQKFGIATANLELLNTKFVQEGVYFVRVSFDSISKNGLLHFGPRPTFGRDRTAELHILDFSENLYGKILTVEILHRERDIQKFQNADALFTQIEKDVVRGRKFFLRQDIFAQWKKVSPTANKAMAEAMIHRLKKHQKFLSAKRIFAYAPTRNEIPFVQKMCLTFPQKKYCFPQVRGRTLYFFETSFDCLEKGKFGILEPNLLAEGEVGEPRLQKREENLHSLPQKNDMIFVPSVAVDHSLHRLGRGGGCYDRFLQTTTAHSLAVIPDFAYVEKVPAEPHDAKVKEIFSIKSGV